MRAVRKVRISWRQSCLALLLLLTPPTMVAGGSGSLNSTAPLDVVGEHTTLITYDGVVRDDELIEYVCSMIPRDDVLDTPTVKDVKVMLNSPYGGGMVDDVARVFGPGGPCEGVPWVAGAASQLDQPAYGPSDGVVNARPAAQLGSRWTNALVDAIEAGGGVLASMEAAWNNDLAGPNGYHGEDPVVASGNGGELIQWNPPGTGHAAVVFGGLHTRLRHDNNILNMDHALRAAWETADQFSIRYGWGDALWGTTARLNLSVRGACQELDENTELVLYFDGYGGTQLDMDEFMGWSAPFSITEAMTIEFDLHSGWEVGLAAMARQPSDEPTPTLDLSLVDPAFGEDWSIELNGSPLPMPAGEFSGTVSLPVAWESIQTGLNRLAFLPQEASPEPLALSNLALDSGPVNEVEMEPALYFPLVLH